jgi:UDP-glucose 4-epimerase
VSRALVTGGAGFIGSHLVDRLLAQGWAVDVVDDLSSGSLANLSAARADRSNELTIHTLDVRIPDLADLVVRRAPDVVFHLALPSRGSERAIVEVGLVGTLNVLEAARRAHVAKVVVGLDALVLYGAVGAKDLPVREGLRPEPSSVTGVASRAVADLLAAYRTTHALEYTALALAHVYGPRQGADRCVVAAFAEAAVSDHLAMVDGDGRQSRDFVFVDDAVDAFVRAAARGSGLVVNVGSGTQTSIRDLHQLVLGSPPAVERAPARSDEPGRFALSPVRARIHLGWAAFTSLADGIEATKAACTPAGAAGVTGSPAEGRPTTAR